VIQRAGENGGGGSRLHGSLLSLVSRFLLPSRCVGCGTLRNDFGGGGVCGACWAVVPRRDLHCPSCALPGNGASCADCRASNPPISEARAVGLYGGVLARIVIAFKFHGYDILAEPASRLMAEATADTACDSIVPVPSTRSRNRERGYDPALLLAQGIASRIGRPLLPLLKRARETVPQSSLAASERRANVHGAFASSPKAAGLSLLLVDDVMTTGATVFSAAQTLLTSGARRVDVVVLARTPEPTPAVAEIRRGPDARPKPRHSWTGTEPDTRVRVSQSPVLESA